MRLRHIEVFHAVMQAGSLSGAAELLNISQPAASKMLGQAEGSLGMLLFKRLPGGLKPTREAELLFVETKHLHTSLENVRRLARNLTTHPGGLLRIGCIPSLGLSLVPQAVARFVRSCPDVSLTIRTDNTETLCTLLLAQEIDIGIAFDPPPMPGIDITALGRARAVYVGPPVETDEALREASAVSSVALAALDPATCIGLDAEDPLGARIVDAFESLDAVATPSKIAVRTYYLARALAEAGVGYTIVDEFTAQAGRPDAPLRAIVPPLSVGVCALTAASHAGSHVRDIWVKQLHAQIDARRAP